MATRPAGGSGVFTIGHARLRDAQRRAGRDPLPVDAAARLEARADPEDVSARVEEIVTTEAALALVAELPRTEAAVVPLRHVAAAPAEAGPQPGEEQALAAFRASPHPTRRFSMFSTPSRAEAGAGATETGAADESDADDATEAGTETETAPAPPTRPARGTAHRGRRTVREPLTRT